MWVWVCGSSAGVWVCKGRTQAFASLTLTPPHSLPFLQVVSASMVPRGKPHPDIYQEAMRRMGCQDPRRAMVIEDAVHGLAAARAAGAFAVGITTSGEALWHLSGHGVSMVVGWLRGCW